MSLDIKERPHNSNLVHFKLIDQIATPDFRKNCISIGKKFLIEWRDPIKFDRPEDAGIMYEYDPSRGLRFEVPEGVGWARVFINEAPEAGPVLALVDLEIRVLSKWDEKFECMWVESQGGKNPRRYEVPGSRRKIEFSGNEWHALRCSAFIDADSFQGDLGFVLNFPMGSEIEIRSTNLAWIPFGDVEESELKETIVKSSVICIKDRDDHSSRLDFADFAEKLKRFLAYEGDLSARIAHLLIKGENASELQFLSLIFEHVSKPCVFDVPHQKTDAVCYEDFATYLDVALIATSIISGGALDEVDMRSISEITQMCGENGRLCLGDLRDLQVVLSPKLDEDLFYWRSLVKAGIISGISEPDSEIIEEQILETDSRFRYSMIGLAAMRRLSVLEDGASIFSRHIGEDSLGSWKDRISSFEEVGTINKVAQLGPSAKHKILNKRNSREIELVMIDGAVTRSRQASNPIALSDAYAFVVRIQPGADLSKMVNIENCCVFNSFFELKEALANCEINLGHKPVVPISSMRSDDEYHVTKAVQKFWGHACSYVLTWGTCSYQSSSGQISVQNSAQTQLSRIALTSCTLCLPAMEVIEADTHQLSWLDFGIFVPSVGFAVSLPITNAIEQKQLVSKVRFVNSELLTPEVKEKLCLDGSVSIPMLQSLEFENWRLGKVIGKRLFDYKRVHTCVAAFVRSHDSKVASTVLEQVQNSPDDWPHSSQDLEGFLLQLASRPEAYLGLSQALFVSFLQRLRHSQIADRAATQISQEVSRICLADYKNIIPTFEFLALCLSQEDLDHALLRVIRHRISKENRFTYRIAECVNRYGSPKVLQIFAILIIEGQPGLLEKGDFLGYFRRLLTYEDRALVEGFGGIDFLRMIEEETGIIDRLLHAVKEENRGAALSILGDADRIKSLNVREMINELRAFSNELQRISLPMSELLLPDLFSLSEKRLVALAFRDVEALRALDSAGALEQATDENAMAKSQLGDNRMLNSIIARQFGKANLSALSIDGETVGEVYENAQAKLSNLPSVLNGPLVTIIMSAFNPDIVLMRKALRSLQMQTHQNTEVFIIDDASDSNSAEQISSLTDEFTFAKIIRLNENAGPYVGRNVALKRARGEFIAIQDADDWSHPQRLAAQLNAFKETPEARLVTSRHIRIDLSGKVQMEAKFQIFGDGPMTSLFRRSVFEETGPFALVRSRGDVEMRERIRDYYGQHSIKEIPVALVLCLADSQTLSQSVKQQYAEHLQLWRSNISQRGSLSHLRSVSGSAVEVPKLIVPNALRVSEPEK